jgi:hypothetical protein
VTERPARKRGAAKSSSSKATDRTAARRSAAKRSSSPASAKRSTTGSGDKRSSSGPRDREPRRLQVVADEPGTQEKQGSSASSRSNGSKPTRSTAGGIAATARDQLQELTGSPVERVTAVGKGDDGWAVTVEVLELRRVPETMDVLGIYDVELDTRGRVTGWRRSGRLQRSDVEGP